METTAKQNFVWENVVKTENECHIGEGRRKATSVRLQSLSVRTRIQCKRTSLPLPSFVSSSTSAISVQSVF